MTNLYKVGELLPFPSHVGSQESLHFCVFMWQDVLTTNPLELMAASSKTYDEIHQILVCVSRKVAPKARTVSCERWEEWQHTFACI